MIFFNAHFESSDSSDEAAADMSSDVKRTPSVKPNIPLTQTTSYRKQMTEMADKLNETEIGIGGSFSGEQRCNRADLRRMIGCAGSPLRYESSSFDTIELEEVITDSKYLTLSESPIEDVMKNNCFTLNQEPEAISVAQEICGSQAILPTVEIENELAAIEIHQICTSNENLYAMQTSDENDYGKKSAYGACSFEAQAEKNIRIEIPSITNTKKTNQENIVSGNYNLADGFEGVKVDTIESQPITLLKPQPPKRNVITFFSSLKKRFYSKNDSLKEGEDLQLVQFQNSIMPNEEEQEETSV